MPDTRSELEKISFNCGGCGNAVLIVIEDWQTNPRYYSIRWRCHTCGVRMPKPALIAKTMTPDVLPKFVSRIDQALRTDHTEYWNKRKQSEKEV